MEADRNNFKFDIGDLVYAPTMGMVLYVLKRRLHRAYEVMYDHETKRWVVELQYLMRSNHNDGRDVWYPESHIDEMLSEGWVHQKRKH